VKAIIFGVNSQDGYYLSRVCLHNQVEVIGVSRSAGEWVQGDVGDYLFVSALIKEHQPEYIFHLAASSTTQHHALFTNHHTISTGTLNILESVKLSSANSRVFITGSGVQFRNEGLPIKETDPFEASSAYAVSRIQSVYAARYFRALGIKTYVGYLFHHESPMRKDSHLSKLIAESVKRIKKGEQQHIEIGNFSVTKEWGFAGDIAKGIFTLVNQDEVAEATIGTGKAYPISAWLDQCFGIAGLNWQDFVIEKSGTFQPEYHLLVSDPGTIRSIGWSAETSISDLAKMMML
jgi:GDPmannose 4,6-dehydratase